MVVKQNIKRSLKALWPGILLFLSGGLAPFFGYGQQTSGATIDSATVADLKKDYFSTIEIQQYAVVVPQIEQYDVTLIGTNNPVVVSKSGKVNQPIVPKQVSLLFRVTRQEDNATAEIPVEQLVVEGRYQDQGSGSTPFVIPSLREWYGHDGFFTLGTAARIVVDDQQDSSLHAVASLLQEDLQKQINRKLDIHVGQAVAGDILLSHLSDTLLGEEGYALSIDDVFHISAPHYKGKVFGTRTLLQLLAQDPEEFRIPKGISRDYPTYAVRGFMLDVGRKFFTMDFLRDYVEIMSYYKMSNFQIHLNDNAFHKYFSFDWDQTPSGFRLESSTYPQLASADGHYTKAEFKALQHKAARYGITIIPEIDVPAHSLAIVKAVPEIGSQQYGQDHLDLHHPKTWEVVKNIFDEYTTGPDPVFIGEEVHIGTDEYDKKEAEAFRAFTDSLIRLVQSNGKKVRAWGALTHAQGATPVTVNGVTLNMWYNGYADPLEMKELGYKQISTPDGWLYIVPAAGYYYDYLNLDRLYNKWAPRQVGNVRFEKGDPTIEGGMFAVWNDIAGNGISEKDVHHRVFPALQVLAEKMWTAEDDNPGLHTFHSKRKYLGEGPGTNIGARYPHYADPLLLHIGFENNMQNKGALPGEAVKCGSTRYTEGISGSGIYFESNESRLTLPIEEIGGPYTVSFWLKPQEQLSDTLFRSKNAYVRIDADGLSYGRDGYEFNVDSTQVPVAKWTQVTVTGDLEGTHFYIDGTLIKEMAPEEITMPYKDKAGKKISFTKVKTLVFPLREVRATHALFDELTVYSTKWSEAEVWSEYQRSRELFKRK